MKTFVLVSIALIWLAALTSCQTRTGAHFFPGMQFDRDGRLIPVGSESLFEPVSGSYYLFFYGANLTSVDHMERNHGDSDAHRSLYLETKRDGRLDRTVKSDLLLTGDFGTVYVEKTCFYNRPVESNYSSVAIAFFSNGYDSGLETPAVLADAPRALPPVSSISLIRLIRNKADYVLVAADYESTGELRGLHLAKANGGKISTNGSSVGSGFRHTALDEYGIPFTLKVDADISSHPLRLPMPRVSEESTWFIQFFDFGKLIQQQKLRAGVPVSSRWLRPSVTKEEQIIGPECDSRLRQQKSMGLPTTGY
ncbi:MAG TPA: hypothetical protein VNX88_03985 [Terriglobales bacterium]|nr:hypothetical protein [Terriglobales bacterium]